MEARHLYTGRHDAMAISAAFTGSRACFNRVINCVIENSADDGIEIVCDAGGVADNNFILGSIFRNNAEVGIEIDAKSADCSASHNEVTNNVVEGTKEQGGIVITAHHGGIADGNNIDGNVVAGNMGCGVFIITSGGLGSSASANVVVNNTLERNNLGGIYLDSDEASVVKDNRIVGNTIKDHGQKDKKGIGLMVRDSNDNLIYHNNFIQNTCQADDDGNNNRWENNGEGNYWSDYTGKDTDGDGIGDIPYEIFGTAKAKDKYPLIEIYGK